MQQILGAMSRSPKKTCNCSKKETDEKRKDKQKIRKKSGSLPFFRRLDVGRDASKGKRKET